MEVLFLAHRAPWPPDKGDRLRAWRHIERLSTLGPVDIVAPADDAVAAEVAQAGLSEICREVAVFPRCKGLACVRTGAALLGRGSLTVAWLSDGRVRSTMKDLCERHEYDLAWAFSSGSGPWLREARAGVRVMDLCDLDSLKWEALARTTAPPKSWVYAAEARRLLPLELQLSREVDLTTVATRKEAEDLAERTTPRRLEILTNGTPWQELDGLPAPSQVGPVLGFLGQMDYPPNVAAAVHLAREVLPAVRETVPEARLLILGRDPDRTVRALASEQVEVTGEVDSVAEALSRVAVFVAPLDTGRGIPNKIIEAMGAARATVVSSWSAHALSGEPGLDYLVADGVECRAVAVAGLLADPARADAVGRAGRDYVRREHDWDAVLDGLEVMVRDVVGQVGGHVGAAEDQAGAAEDQAGAAEDRPSA